MSGQVGRRESVNPLVLWARWTRIGALRFLSPTARDSLSVIAAHAGKGGAWPSAALVAKLTGHKRESVFRGLKELVARGILVSQGRQPRKGGGAGPRVYVLAEAPESLDAFKREVPSRRTSARRAEVPAGETSDGGGRGPRRRDQPSPSRGDSPGPSQGDPNVLSEWYHQGAAENSQSAEGGADAPLTPEDPLRDSLHRRVATREESREASEVAQVLLLLPAEDWDRHLAQMARAGYGSRILEEGRRVALQVSPSWPYPLGQGVGADGRPTWMQDLPLSTIRLEEGQG